MTSALVSRGGFAERARSSGRAIRGAPFIIRLLLSAALGVTIVYPFVRLIEGSFRDKGALAGGDLTLRHYEDTLSDTSTYRLLWNTILFATGQTVVPVAIGVILAWLVTRTDLPMRRLWETMTIALYFIPLLAAGTAWIILLGPRNGLINVVIRDYTPFGGLSAYSMGGMILIQSIYLVPLVFLVVGASFRAVNPELEEASRVSGASPWSTFIRITFGVARPAVASAAMLCFIIGLGSLEIPLLFGFPGRVYLLTTDVYSALRVRFPPEYGRAGAISVLLLLMALAVLWVYVRMTHDAQRYVTVGGRTGRPLLTRLGRWRWVCFAGCSIFFFFALVLPFAAVLVGSTLPFIGRPSWDLISRASLDNYSEVADNPVMWRAVRNSLMLSVVTGLAVALVGALIAYFTVRLPSRWSRSLDFGATLPLTIPAIVLAAGLLFSYISFDLPGFGPLYGSRLLMGMAYFAYFIPVAVRQMSGPLFQISADLEHASRISGANRFTTMRRIVAPLLLPALGGAFLLAFITYLREFVNSVLLFGPGSEVISVVMYSYYSNGRLPSVAVIAVVLSTVVLALILVLGRVFKIKISF